MYRIFLREEQLEMYKTDKDRRRIWTRNDQNNKSKNLKWNEENENFLLDIKDGFNWDNLRL